MEFFEQGRFANLLLQEVTSLLIEGKRVLKCADSEFSQAGTPRSDGGHGWARTDQASVTVCAESNQARSQAVELEGNVSCCVRPDLCRGPRAAAALAGVCADV